MMRDTNFVDKFVKTNTSNDQDLILFYIAPFQYASNFSQIVNSRAILYMSI